MASIKTPTVGVYVDDLRFYGGGFGYGYYGYGYGYGYYSPYTSISAPILLYNTIPEHQETGVPRNITIQLHIASVLLDGTGAHIALDNTTKVWIVSDTDNVQRLAYDQVGGGFQAGFNGALSSAAYQASPGSSVNDEIILWIDPTVDFQSGAVITVMIEAAAGSSVLRDQYYFTIVDEGAPAISDLLWITPRRCMITFDRIMETRDQPGSIGWIEYLNEGIEILNSTTVEVLSQTPLAAWVGFPMHITGSADPRNNKVRTITAVNTTTRTVTLDITTAGELIADDGRDADEQGRVRRVRKLRAAVCPYSLSARLTEEGTDYSLLDPRRVQCAYEPIPVAINPPEPEWLPVGIDINQVAVVDWHDDISYGRLYTLIADGVQDYYGERIAGGPDAVLVDSEATYQFQSPMFGLSRRRKVLWDRMPVPDQDEDMNHEQQLRKMAVVIQDLFDTIEYRVKQMEHLEDPHRCPEHMLDYLLYDLGNPFNFDMTEPFKRRLADMLRRLYDQLGLVQGIEGALKFFLGYDFQILPFWTSLDIWILGTSVLGYTGPSGPTGECILGPGTAYAKNCYEIISPVALTTVERAMVIQIATWADPAEMHLVRIIEPGDTSGHGAAVTYWVLGSSVLNVSTTLGGV